MVVVRIKTRISLDSISGNQPNISLLDHLFHCAIDPDCEVSIEMNVDDRGRCNDNNNHLTRLSFSASAKHFAPSLPIPLYHRLRVSSVY